MKKKPVNKRSADYKAGKDDGYKLGYDDGLKALKENLGNDWVYKLGHLDGIEAGREFQETARALEKPTKGKPEPVDDDVDDPELLAEIAYRSRLLYTIVKNTNKDISRAG